MIKIIKPIENTCIPVSLTKEELKYISFNASGEASVMCGGKSAMLLRNKLNPNNYLLFVSGK